LARINYPPYCHAHSCNTRSLVEPSTLIVVFSLIEHKIRLSGDSLTFDGGSKTIATPVLDVALAGLLFKGGWLTGVAEEKGGEREEGIEASRVVTNAG